jgi:hypothetical protein
MGILLEIAAHQDDQQAPPTARELETLALMERGIEPGEGSTENEVL